MRRTAMGLGLLLACLLALCLPAAAEGQEPVITSYKAQCTVDANGQANMTVTVDVSIDEPLTELTLPIGAGVSGSVSGREAKAVSTDEGNALRIEDETGIAGRQTFVLTYAVPKAVAAHDEGQRLTLELIAPGWPWAMDEAAFAVAMPADFSEEPVYVGGYYGDVVEDYMNLQTNGRTFSGIFKESLRDHESLSVTLDLPADFVDLSRGGGISGTVAMILVAVLALLAVGYWYIFLRNPSLSVPLRPLPPDGAGAGELPMLSGRGDAELALQVMQWACLGYLTVHRAGRERIVLRQHMTMGTERRRREQAFFAQLFARNSICDGEGVRFGHLAQRYAQGTRSAWQRRLYAKSSGSPLILQVLAALAAGAAMLGAASEGLMPSSARAWLLVLLTVGGIVGGILAQEGFTAAARLQRKLILLAVPAAMLAAGWLWGGFLPVLLAVALQAFAALATLRGGRRSAAGRENLAQILGFQRYLQHVNANQLRSQLQRDSQYFYQMLPFAEAVGQGKTFAAKFGRTPMEPCAWFACAKPPATAADFYQLFHDTLHRMERARR